MNNCTRIPIRIILLSDLLIASGEGHGAAIDRDVVYDDAGIPYIPGRRLKGCLRDSAIELNNMLQLSSISPEYDLNELFGVPGSKRAGLLTISNLRIADYEANRQWLLYSMNQHAAIITAEAVKSRFTRLHSMTRIDENGVAEDHTLRTVRALNEGLEFFGEIEISSDCEHFVEFIAWSCLNLRHMGTMRNRGFGEIEVRLLDNNGAEAGFINKLEAKCKG